MSRSQSRKTEVDIKAQVLRVMAVTLGSLAISAQAQTTPAPGGNPGVTAPSQSPSASAFMRADADGDGKLTKQEAQRLPAIAAKFDAIDKDKDGALSQLEFDAGVSEKTK